MSSSFEVNCKREADDWEYMDEVDFDEDDGDWEMEIQKLPVCLEETQGLILGAESTKEKREERREEDTLGLIFHRFDELERLWKDKERLQMNAQSAKNIRDERKEIKKKELFPCVLVMFPEVGPAALVAIVVGYLGLKAAFWLLRQVDERERSPSPTLTELRVMFMEELGKGHM
jgi:hypothetical protein